MRRQTQRIEECNHCGRTFEDGEDYWKSSRNECYCTENKCGWEDEDELADEFLEQFNKEKS